MDLKQIKTFISVAESGSFSRASDRLHIVQPALSRQIRLLEHEIGVNLFTRHVRGMELTEVGMIKTRSLTPAVRRKVMLATPQDRSNTRATKAVIECLKNEVQIMVNCSEWPNL